MPMLAPLTTECLLGELTAIVQDVRDAADRDTQVAAGQKLGKLKVRSHPSSFRGMWRSRKLATYGKPRHGKGGHHASRAKLLSEPSPTQATAPFSAPASIGVMEPGEFGEPQSFVGTLRNLEIAPATGSQGPRRSSSNAPLPVSVQQPLPRTSTSLAPVQAPATPRLGLRPPCSASSTGPPTPALRVTEKIEQDALALAAAAALVSQQWTKPKIAAWGGRTRLLQAMGGIGSLRKADTPPPKHAKARPCSEIGEDPVEQVCCKPMRARITRPRPACRLNSHLEHTELLRQNSFTTSTTPYRTYGTQWVLMQQRTNHTLLAAELERDRDDIAQFEELLHHGIDKKKK